MSASIAVLLYLHTAISLVAIVAGLVVTAHLLSARVSRFWTDLFLVTAIATSVTGYFFPFSGVTPAQIVGAVALAILAVVLFARHQFRLAGAWRCLRASVISGACSRLQALIATTSPPEIRSAERLMPKKLST